MRDSKGVLAVLVLVGAVAGRAGAFPCAKEYANLGAATQARSHAAEDVAYCPEACERDRSALVAAEKAESEARARLKACEKIQDDAEAAEVAAAAHRAARIKAAQDDPKVMRVVISAWICRYAAQRAEALREIAAEKKYAKLGGVVNRARLYELQGDVRDADESTAMFRKGLRAIKAKPMGCRDRSIAPLALCLAEGAAECPLAPDALVYDVAMSFADD